MFRTIPTNKYIQEEVFFLVKTKSLGMLIKGSYLPPSSINGN